VEAVATDAQLVSRCRAGEAEAWNELVERFSRYVYAIAVQAFRFPQHDAEDAFQEVFARIYEHLGRLRNDEAIRPWIAQLTRRVCIDRLRVAGREGLFDPDELETAELDETLGRLDEAMTVRAGLDAVGDPCRRLPRDPRPVLLPRRELPGDRRGARPAGRDGREPDLPVPHEASGRAGGKIVTGSRVWRSR
jgi:RNA polymerase sigma factor (sigma-70 family)